MKKIVIGISLAATMFLANANAQNANGKAIFATKGCVACHKSDVDTIGPSLKTIATAYSGKQSSLIAYLQGTGTPIIDAARASVMNPQLLKLRTLLDEDMRALAEHIVSASDRPF